MIQAASIAPLPYRARKVAAAAVMVLAGGLAFTTNATADTPAVTVSPASINFGTVTLGDSAPAQPVTITANTTVTIVGFAMDTQPGFSPPTFYEDYFPLTNDGCTGQTLQAGQSCTINLNFGAIQPFPPPGILAVTYQTPGGQQTTIDGPDVTATVSTTSGNPLGAPPTGPTSVAPETLQFGNQVVGQQSSTQTVTVVTGLFPSPGNLSYQATAGYSVVSDSCPADTVEPALSWSCQVLVAFDPTAAGDNPGQLTLQLTSPNVNSTETVALDGTGATAPPPSIPEAPGVTLLPLASLGLMAAGVSWQRRSDTKRPVN